MSEYVYAHPKNRAIVYPPQGHPDPDIKTGNPFEGATGEIAPISSFPAYQQITYSRFDPFTHGRGQIIGDAADTAPGSLITALTPASISQSRPAGIETFNNEKKTTIKPIVDPVFKTLVPGTWFGFVVEKKGDNLYTTRVYFDGFSAAGTTIDVKIGRISEDSTLPPDYPLTVHRAVWVNKTTGFQQFEYWAQPAIWVPFEDT
jgi:hypothetical protein